MRSQNKLPILLSGELCQSYARTLLPSYEAWVRVFQKAVSYKCEM
jgi:hypothetical protein